MKRKLDWMLKSQDARILTEDDDILLINKPANLLVLPDRYNRSLPNLYEILRTELGQIYVVHRIDKETSGLILFAKSSSVHWHLNEQFEKRAVEKIYQAICVGNVSLLEGRIDIPLREDSKKHVVRVDKKRGKESVTQYRVQEEFRGYALVEARPRTGRMHQIRIHLREISLPILSDPLYGDGKPFYLSTVKTKYKREGEEKALLSRTALHAFGLRFEHPSTKRIMECEAPLPKDMKTVLNYLRKFRSLDQELN